MRRTASIIVAAALFAAVSLTGPGAAAAPISDLRSKSQCDKVYRTIDMYSLQGNGKKKEPFSVGAYYMLFLFGSDKPSHKRGALRAIKTAKKVTGPKNDALLNSLRRSIKSTNMVDIDRYKEIYDKLIDNIDEGIC